jgi:protein-tyrosine phosphatase
MRGHREDPDGAARVGAHRFRSEGVCIVAGSPAPERRLDWEACYNARDVGGYHTAGGGSTRWRGFFRSDNLCRLSPNGQAALLAAGVRTVIDLRSPFELRIDPCPFDAAPPLAGGPAYVNLPVIDPADRAAATAIDRAETVATAYARMLDSCQIRLATILRAVAAAPPGGVLVYCHAGKDRTGLVTALVLALAGVAPATIAEDYALSDGFLQPWYHEQLRTAPSEARREWLTSYLWSSRNVAHPEAMLATLAYLDRQHRGVRPYLRAAGVTEPELERIRRRLGA